MLGKRFYRLPNIGAWAITDVGQIKLAQPKQMSIRIWSLTPLQVLSPELRIISFGMNWLSRDEARIAQMNHKSHPAR